MAGNPFKLGHYVVGEDPFNGRHEGVVMDINGKSIGLQAIDRPEGAYIYYDYRQVREPD